MNINMLRDSDNDAGFYAAACASDPDATWKGAVLYVSGDGGANYSALATITAETTMGTTTTALGDFHSGNIPDELNTVNVRLNNGTLSSTDANGLLSGARMAVIGDEILFFRDATLESDGSYTLRGFLRGRRGSEYAMGLHAIGDRFVLVDATTMVRIPDDTSAIGIEKLFKAVSAGRSLARTTAKAFTNEGMGLKPYAPVHLGGGWDASGNVTLTWVRRTRIDGNWRNGVEVPLGEESEEYAVEIYTDSTYSTIRRTFTGVTGPSQVYSIADQVLDFAGVAPSVVYFRVYQVSAVVGRGHGAQGTAPATITTFVRAPAPDAPPPVTEEPEVPSAFAYVAKIEPFTPTEPQDLISYATGYDPKKFASKVTIVTAPSHPFRNGQRITFSGVGGLSRTHIPTDSQLAGQIDCYLRFQPDTEFVVWDVTNDTFLINIDTRPYIGSVVEAINPHYYGEYSKYTSGGVANLVSDAAKQPIEITQFRYVLKGVYDFPIETRRDTLAAGVLSGYGTPIDPATITEPMPDSYYMIVKRIYTVPGHSFAVGDVVTLTAPHGTFGTVPFTPDEEHILFVGEKFQKPHQFHKRYRDIYWPVVPPLWNEYVQEVDGDDVVLYDLIGIDYLSVLASYQSMDVTTYAGGGTMSLSTTDLIWDGTRPPADI